ncbi:MAG: endonuclease III [SAR324 cluster bacterium]|jgi:endonuclease-3|nr:endonuclease III [Deltaproteobacteria bacterium]MDP6091272.1 endonuclease III [SAR324 cluster bacterium]MBI11725.1 endonuclease III [Deltaproteobacteria bacterium]MBP43135.1 endonuclease III [Deltaproteobacteria bacterium]MDP6247778.1 endonuclease III [SAR324 cluster bacterium]|tara:strand:- start:5263 stop:5895 length:633 start_codon:yes stop_codon:yes gene_type:complete
MSPARRKSLFEKLSVAIPNPETELAHDNPFQLLISVILSAQATDISVNKVTPALFEAFPDPESMATARVEQILSFIRSIGLAPSKAKNIVNTCSLLVEKHQGQIPQTLEELIALPGVGRKTANVMLNTAFGKSVIAVDTHIFRVSNRTGLAIGKDVREVEDGLMKNVPRKFKKDAHHLLILHGRYVCKARKPECSQCVIRRQCQFEEKII